MHDQIASIILTEVAHPFGMTLAENLRAAAWYVMEDFPQATSKDFADAAAAIGLHWQGARNRWNEAKANMEVATA